MVIIDYIILGAFLVSVIVGLFRGFFREALSLLTWVVALWVTLEYAHLMEPLLASVSSPVLRLWATRLLTFLLVLIAGGLLNHLIAVLVTRSGLSGTDRVLGMVFGAARGLLVVGIMVVIFRLMGLEREPWWQESRLVAFVEPVAEQVQRFSAEGLSRLEQVVGPADKVLPATEAEARESR